MGDYNLKSEGKRAKPSALLEKGFVDIGRIHGGASIGDQTLIDLIPKKKLATVKTLTRCHFMTLTKVDFLKSLEAIALKVRQDKSNFIKRFPPFQKLNRSQLTKLSFHLTSIKCNRDHFLFREGDLADKLFMIREGEFVVTKKKIQSD